MKIKWYLNHGGIQRDGLVSRSAANSHCWRNNANGCMWPRCLTKQNKARNKYHFSRFIYTSLIFPYPHTENCKSIKCAKNDCRYSYMCNRYAGRYGTVSHTLDKKWVVERWKCFEIATSFFLLKCLWVVRRRRRETHFSKRLVAWVMAADDVFRCYQNLKWFQDGAACFDVEHWQQQHQ